MLPDSTVYEKKELIIGSRVEPGNPNLDQASFPTGMVDPLVGISLSQLATNDGFSMIKSEETDSPNPFQDTTHLELFDNRFERSVERPLQGGPCSLAP